MPLRSRLVATFDSASRMFAVVSGLVVAAVVALNLYAPASPSLAQRSLASLLVVLCAVPSLMWASKRRWDHSLMPYVGVMYATYFAMPVFLRQDFFGAWFSRPLVADSTIEWALLLALGGWAALMAGYFVVVRGRIAEALPAVRVLPHGESRLAATVAVVVGLAAAPLLYLDNAAVVSLYVGEVLLAPAIAFPVTLAGQFVVFALLVLFYLHLRGELGVKGRVFMVALGVYYTVLGLSTGMVNHGVKAVFALFVAYAITVRTPTWRGIAYGLATAAILFFVLVPTRDEYRRLIWTHGIDAAAIWRLTAHQFDTIDGSAPAFETDAYTIALQDRVLTFAHKDPSTCGSSDPREAATLGVFLHIEPVDLNDLPVARRQYGFDNLDFYLATGDVVDGRCVRATPLPDYEIDAIRAGLYRLQVPLSQMPYLPGRIELESVVFDTRPRADGEWKFETKNDSTWQIDASERGTSRLLLVLADAEKRDDLMMAQAGSVVRVVLDDDNWAEYVVDQLDAEGERVVLGLAVLSDYRGDRAGLREGDSAILHHERTGPIAASLGHETLGGPGRNPWASRAHDSLAVKTTVYATSLFSAFDGEDQTFSSTYSTIDRLDRLLPLAWLIANTPVPVRFLEGQTLTPLLFKLIPRAVYKEKPVDTADLGQRYGFVPFANRVNAFKVHQLGELYANFGTLGTLIGMFVLGVLYRVLYHLFHRRGASVVTMAAGTHMLTVLMLEMEAILSVSWGFLMWYAVAVGALALLVRLGLRFHDRGAHGLAHTVRAPPASGASTGERHGQ